LIPDELVELGVDSDIGSLHHLGNQVSNFRKGLGSFLLELSFMCKLVNVDGGVDSTLRETFSLLFFSHFNHEIINIKNIIFLFLCFSLCLKCLIFVWYSLVCKFDKNRN
jgi:hypothetical protein